MNKLKKILIYTDVPYFAGCENVLENIVSYTKINTEFEIVFCYRRSHQYTYDLKNRSINVPIFPVFVLSNDPIFSFLKNIFGTGLLYRLAKLPFSIIERSFVLSIVNFFILYRLVCKHAPDIVHINNGGYPGAATCRVMALSAKKAGIKKIIFTVNNIACPQTGIIDKLLDKAIDARVNYFTTASHAASNQLTISRGFYNDKLKVIANTILFDGEKLKFTPRLRKEFSIPKDVKIIGSVGLLTKRKGYHVLIEAAKQIVTYSNWCIFIFGEGEEREILNEMIKKNNLSDRIFLPGFRSNIMDYVLDFDVFVLPSTNNEDLPNVINEAMLLGKPVIGTMVAGIPEQIDDGVTGYLVKPQDEKELSEALAKVTQMSYNQLENMGKSSKNKYLNQFSYCKSMDKYYTLYKSLALIVQ